MSPDNKAAKYCKALNVAIKLAKNPVLVADLTELRDRLMNGHLQWRGGAQCVPNNQHQDHRLSGRGMAEETSDRAA